jgi:hypothetical protein
VDQQRGRDDDGESGGGDILTKMPFTNVFVHVEYWSPKFDYPERYVLRTAGASGVFLKAPMMW